MKTRSVSNAEKTAAFASVMNVIYARGMLPWHEGLRVGATCQGLRGLWKQHEDRHYQTLLQHLNRMCHSNHCRMYGGVLWPRDNPDACSCEYSSRDLFEGLDPRANAQFGNLAAREKCRILAGYVAFLVTNIRSYMHYDRLTDEDALPPGYAGWEWDWMPKRTLRDTRPRRYAFIMNVIANAKAKQELEDGMYHFEDGFLGDPNFHPYFGSSFRDELGEVLARDFIPGHNEQIETYLRSCYRTSLEWERNLLGPILYPKLDCLAPFFHENGQVAYPPDMEPRGLDPGYDEGFYDTHF